MKNLGLRLVQSVAAAVSIVIAAAAGAATVHQSKPDGVDEELSAQTDAAVIHGLASSAAAPGPGWSVQTVDGPGSVGFYKSLAYNPVTGFPAIAYSDDGKGTAKFASWNGSSWGIQTIDPWKNGNSSIALAFDSAGNPAVCYGYGKLKFAHWTGSSWSYQVIESSNYTNGVVSLVYHNGQPVIAYKINGGVQLAQFSGSTWAKEVVDPQAAGGYVSLAYDADGNPGVAYSDATPGSGLINVLKYAHKSGSAWTVQVVETGTVGFGAFASLAYDPLSGNPSIAHSNAVGGVRFLRWDGSEWVLEIPDSGRSSYYSIAYDLTGIAAISYELSLTPNSGFTQVRLARRMGCSNTCWQTELVEDVSPSMVQWQSSLAFAPTGSPGVAYHYYGTQDLRFAQKAP